MPKTRDAFAFRDLENAVRSVACRYFIPSYSGRKGRSMFEFQPVKYLDSKAGRIEQILQFYFDRNNKNAVIDIENKQAFNPSDSTIDTARKELLLYGDRIKTLRESMKRLNNHIVRLKSYEHKIFEKVFTEGLNDVLKSKGERVRELIKVYSWIISGLLSRYEIILVEDYEKLEEIFQQECRSVFSKRLRQARQATGLTQRAFAKIIGMSPTGYCQYENGQSDPNIPMLIQLSSILDCSLDWLFGRISTEKKDVPF